MRKYSSLVPITTDTLMKYMELLNQRVLGKLKDYVPDSNVYLKFDSWSCDDEHYTAVNLSWSLFLRMNKHLWDVHDVHACLKGEEAAAVAEARDSSSPSTSTLSSASVSSDTNA